MAGKGNLADDKGEPVVNGTHQQKYRYWRRGRHGMEGSDCERLDISWWQAIHL